LISEDEHRTLRHFALWRCRAWNTGPHVIEASPSQVRGYVVSGVGKWSKLIKKQRIDLQQ
jgi:hypothetical protein